MISLDRVYEVVVLNAAEGDADDDKWDVEEAGLRRTDTENDVNVVLGWVTVVTGNVVVKARTPEIVESAVEDTGTVRDARVGILVSVGIADDWHEDAMGMEVELESFRLCRGRRYAFIIGVVEKVVAVRPSVSLRAPSRQLS